MSRVFAAFVASICLVFPLAARADLPFGFRFVERKDDTIQITKIEVEGLAGQIGLRQDDVVKKINGTDVQSKASLDRALQDITKNKTYDIEIFRPRDKKNFTFKGDIKEGKAGAYYVVPQKQ